MISQEKKDRQDRACEISGQIVWPQKKRGIKETGIKKCGVKEREIKERGSRKERSWRSMGYRLAENLVSACVVEHQIANDERGAPGETKQNRRKK